MTWRYENCLVIMNCEITLRSCVVIIIETAIIIIISAGVDKSIERSTEQYSSPAYKLNRSFFQLPNVNRNSARYTK